MFTLKYIKVEKQPVYVQRSENTYRTTKVYYPVNCVKNQMLYVSTVTATYCLIKYSLLRYHLFINKLSRSLYSNEISFIFLNILPRKCCELQFNLELRQFNDGAASFIYAYGVY